MSLETPLEHAVVGKRVERECGRLGAGGFGQKADELPTDDPDAAGLGLGADARDHVCERSPLDVDEVERDLHAPASW